MDFYLTKNPADAEWLARASLFHGHLGPWLVAGCLVGRDAVRRLDTPGHWKIDVTCWMPSDKQRTPFSCMLDGLQASSGATLGKQNIRFAYAEDVLSSGWPVVYVVRRQDKNRPAEGFVYEAMDGLHAFMTTVKPEKLEEDSRRLAAMAVDELFKVRPMTQDELLLADRVAGRCA